LKFNSAKKTDIREAKSRKQETESSLIRAWLTVALFGLSLLTACGSGDSSSVTESLPSVQPGNSADGPSPSGDTGVPEAGPAPSSDGSEPDTGDSDSSSPETPPSDDTSSVGDSGGDPEPNTPEIASQWSLRYLPPIGSHIATYYSEVNDTGHVVGTDTISVK
jgi:hypothetical protein